MKGHDPLAPFFLDWAAKNVIYNLALNPDLDEGKLLVSLNAFKEEMVTKIQLSKNLEQATMQNVVLLGNKRARFEGSIYAEILAEALRKSIDDLDALEGATRSYERQLRVIEVFIDAVKNAIVEE